MAARLLTLGALGVGVVANAAVLALVVGFGGLGFPSSIGWWVVVIGLAAQAVLSIGLPRGWWQAALAGVGVGVVTLIALAQVELMRWPTDVRETGAATMLRTAGHLVGGALVVAGLASLRSAGRKRAARIAAGVLGTIAVAAASHVMGYFRDDGLLPFAQGGRVAAYDRLWRNLERYYARWDRAAIALPALRERYRSLVIAADDACSYFDRCPAYHDAIRDMLAELQDGHTHVVPLELAIPPLVIEPIEGRPIITRGAWRGAAVVGVDDRPVAEALAAVPRYAIAYRARHTQERQRYAMVLAGPAWTPVAVTLEAPAGNTVRVVVLRSSDPFGSPAQVSSRVLAPGIAYLTVPHLRSADVVTAAGDALARAADARGLVLDLRGNGGGWSTFGDRIVGHLITEPVSYGTECFRARHPLRDLEGCIEHTLAPIAPTFRGRIAVLLDGDVASSAEQMALALCTTGRATCFGATTAGDSGNPLPHFLPGVMAQFSTGELWMRDGRRLDGTGVAPHVPIAVARADVIAGRDPVLDAATRSLDGP